jgi:hypothetical protein
MPPTITAFDLLAELRGILGPWCHIDIDRPEFAVMPLEWLQAKLAASRLDRMKWSEGLAKQKQQRVCTSFAKLLDGWLEQERIRDGIALPHATGRLTFSHDTGAHKLNWAWTDAGFRIVEPQDDRVLALLAAHRNWPDFKAQEAHT